MTFGERLRELRAGAGLSQAQLAAAAGLPVTTLRNYEQGRNEPPWRPFCLLARALGADYRAFLKCEERPPSRLRRKRAKA